MKEHIFYFILLLTLNSTAQNIIDVYCFDDSCSHQMIDPEMLVVERWDTLAQSKFWKTIITTTKDTCVINIASTRQILDYVYKDKWFEQTEKEKKAFKDSVIDYYCLDTNTRLYITTGKKSFIK